MNKKKLCELIDSLKIPKSEYCVLYDIRALEKVLNIK